VISLKHGKYYINYAEPVKNRDHFPFLIEDDLSTMPTDCFFHKADIAIPEFEEKSFLFFPLEPASRDLLFLEGWFFISSEILKDKELKENLFLYADILREGIKNIVKLEKVKELIIIDDVTGLYNTRHLYSVLDQSVANSERFFTQFSLIFLDIDHFKQVNDTYGHLVGSKLLKMMGQLIVDNLRKTDIAFRYGGDEFVVFLPHTAKGVATIVVRRLWESLRNHSFNVDGIEVSITGSFGMAGFPEDGQTVKEIIDQADLAMYTVKKNSRDSVKIVGVNESFE